jgi:hypothetical protein
MPSRPTAFRLASALCAALVACATPALAVQGGITTTDPTTTKPTGDAAGSIGTIAASKHDPDSTAVSLDAVAANPGRYDGKTLARRVTLGNTKGTPVGVAVAARDAETGGKVNAEATPGAFALVMTKEFAGRLGAPPQTEAVVTFTVTKIPIPGQEMWLGVISRIQLLGADGSVARTVEPN